MTMSATTKTVVSLEAIYDAMRDAYRAALTTGRNWHAVTVGTDGAPYLREEVSKCVSESEHFGTGDPYPVTVYWVQGDGSVDADDIGAELDAFDAADVAGGDLTEALEAAGFTVED